MLNEEIKFFIEDVLELLSEQKKIEKIGDVKVSVEYPRDKANGDYSSDVAMQLARVLKKNPIEVANLIVEKLNNLTQKPFDKIQVANPGFINFFISKEYLQNQVQEILKQKNKFGNLNIGDGKKINVEFISGNPTGPLTLGNGRGGFCGDVLSNVFKKVGYKVVKEYYINDRGEQIIKLGHSVLKDELAVYKGEYVEELSKKINGVGAEKVGEKAAQYILKKMIQPVIKRMGIKYDVWFSENSLYKNKSVDKAIAELKDNGFTYESEGAVWFKSKELEDDKDRVLVRKDGTRTYFASDIAYLKNKYERGFDKLFFFLGADHHGYLGRLKAGAESLGYDKGKIETIVMQLVHLYQNGKEYKMSKRAGTYVTLDELLDEVSLDAARFFFLMRGNNTHLNFDMSLAKEQSSKNPVFYVQYAYARISSILKKKKPSAIMMVDYNLINEEAELNLLKHLIKFPEVIAETAYDYQLQRLTQYSTELADCFHQFYEKCRVITEDKKLTQARLSVILATKIVLKNTFDLLGISAPEKM